MKELNFFALLIVAGAIYFGSKSFDDWADPVYLSDVVASDLAYYMAENIVEEGVLYPSNDLSDPLLEARKIVVSHAMNEHTVKDVVRKLLYLDSISHEPIDLYISTPGGWYDSAYSIIDTFHAIESSVNTRCIGGCYSAGLVLLASGTGVREAYPHALLSVHISYGGGEDERPYAKLPDRVNDHLQRVTDLPKEWFPLENGRSYYLTTEQALAFSVIDAVVNDQK